MISPKDYKKYQRYLKSESWHRKRQRKFNQVGRYCEVCKSVHRIEVHHLTYERLGKERLSDLQVLCEDCHPLADEVRRRVKAIDTYMSKVYGEGWQSQYTNGEAATQFDQWLESK